MYCYIIISYYHDYNLCLFFNARRNISLEHLYSGCSTSSMILLILSVVLFFNSFYSQLIAVVLALFPLNTLFCFGV